jgi:hypothetical protein
MPGPGASSFGQLEKTVAKVTGCEGMRIMECSNSLDGGWRERRNNDFRDINFTFTGDYNRPRMFFF